MPVRDELRTKPFVRELLAGVRVAQRRSPRNERGTGFNFGRSASTHSAQGKLKNGREIKITTTHRYSLLSVLVQNAGKW